MLKTYELEIFYKICKTFNNFNAYVKCTFGFIDTKENYSEGIVKGKITLPKDNTDFGLDAIFKLNGSNLTFREMSLTEKNKFSHRAKAINHLQHY